MRTIFFDIDNTLVDYFAAESAAAKFLYQSYGGGGSISEESFFRQWKESTELHYQQYLCGKLGLQEQRRLRMESAFGRAQPLGARKADHMFAQYLACYEANWRLFPDVIPALERLRGFSKGIISNGDPDQQRRKLAALGIADHFEGVLISGDIGIPKPDRRIFERAAGMLGKDMAQCTYIGDHLDTDVRAAEAAGFEAYWIVRPPAPRADDGASVPSLEVFASHMSQPKD